MLFDCYRRSTIDGLERKIVSYNGRFDTILVHVYTNNISNDSVKRCMSKFDCLFERIVLLSPIAVPCGPNRFQNAHSQMVSRPVIDSLNLKINEKLSQFVGHNVRNGLDALVVMVCILIADEIGP